MDLPPDSDAVSEVSNRSKSRSRRSSSSSARSMDDDFINDDEEDVDEDNYASDASEGPKTKQAKKQGTSKSKSGATSRPSLKHAQSSSASALVGENAFLTAAERRALEKKNEKKSSEDPYAFLQDPRDVRFNSISITRF